MDMPSTPTVFCKFLQWTVGIALWCSLAWRVWENYQGLTDLVSLVAAPIFITLMVNMVPLAIGFLASILLKYDNE